MLGFKNKSLHSFMLLAALMAIILCSGNERGVGQCMTGTPGTEMSGTEEADVYITEDKEDGGTATHTETEPAAVAADTAEAAPEEPSLTDVPEETKEEPAKPKKPTAKKKKASKDVGKTDVPGQYQPTLTAISDLEIPISENRTVSGSAVYLTDDLEGEETQGILVCAAALSRLGAPYTNDHKGRFSDGADCSSLVYMAYMEAAGISLKTKKDGVTAASEAELCVERDWIISVGYDSGLLLPGDIIFWTTDTPRFEGRYFDIYHAGIYLGNGECIEASSSEGKVVTRKVWETETEKIIYTARPLGEGIGKEEAVKETAEKK